MAGSKRILWVVALSCTALLFFLVSPLSFSLPSSFNLSRHTEDQPTSHASDTTTHKMSGGRMRVQEIHGLLHLVAQSDGYLPSGVDGSQDLDLQVYADAAGGGDDWQAYTKKLYAETPVIVFSKTFCPYSRKAKELLAQYKLSPAPKIVELDERSDAAVIKQILTRLTGRGTVPNILINGDSIGGSDDIHELHVKGELRSTFEDNGVKVLGAV